MNQALGHYFKKVLGVAPLFFVIRINDLPKHLKNTQIGIHADDTVSYRQSRTYLAEKGGGAVSPPDI